MTVPFCNIVCFRFLHTQEVWKNVNIILQIDSRPSFCFCGYIECLARLRSPPRFPLHNSPPSQFCIHTHTTIPIAPISSTQLVLHERKECHQLCYNLPQIALNASAKYCGRHKNKVSVVDNNNNRRSRQSHSMPSYESNKSNLHRLALDPLFVVLVIPLLLRVSDLVLRPVTGRTSEGTNTARHISGCRQRS